MNINYDEIISKANTRAEALKDFAQYTRDAGERASGLLVSLAYFRDMGNRVQAMDSEGQALLGPAATRAKFMGTWAGNMYKHLTPAHSDNLKLSELLEALQ